MPRQIVVRIPDALHKWLKKTADREEILISELVRHMLYDQRAQMDHDAEIIKGMTKRR